MTRTLITRPQYVLIFEVTDEMVQEHLERTGAAIFNFDLPPQVIGPIKEHFDSLAPGEEPDLSRFNLPDGVTVRVEQLRLDKPAVMLGLKGPEVPIYRDITRDYVPEGLREPAPWVVEVGERPDRRRLVQAGYGLANEMNRNQGEWKYADVSPEQDGSHWSHFTGHHTQVDINVTTYNYRDTHDWKGKESVQGRARWTVALDRVQVGEGYSGTWEGAHRAAAEYARRMQDEVSPVSGLTSSWRDAEKELLGRPVWYREQPAYIDMVLLDQGCIVVKPAMAEDFTIDPRFGDDFPQDERDSAKVELLSDSIYWYRDNADKDLFTYTPRDYA